MSPLKKSSNPIFKDCVVSIAGDLDDYDWREEKVKQWVHYWGGTFSSIVDGNVTHLLCTKKNFDKNIADVRVALRSKDTKIVRRDWLEDSINKVVRLKTLPYQLDEEAKQEKAKTRQIQKREKYSKNAENYVDEGFWHVYSDSTYFQYQIQLKRDDKESGNVGEKYLLTLWESNAKPYNYQCTVLFTKKGSRSKSSRCPPDGTPVNLKTGLKAFERLFRKKTGIEWNDRIEKMGTMGLEHFQYQPPSGGKPVGLINGRHVSIFGEDGRIGASNQTSTKAQHDDNPAERVSAVKPHRKRGKEECLADEASVNAENEERPVKRVRFETAEAARMSVESEVHSAGEASAAGSEPEEDMQVYDELISGEAAQDLDNLNAAQCPPESDNAASNSARYRHVYRSELDSACGHDAPRPYRDGLAAPCNSPVDDREVNDDENMAEDGDDEEVDDDGEEMAEYGDDPRCGNTEQEADDISELYNEAQNAEISDDEEDAAPDDDDEVDEYSPEAVRARRLAREVSAAAANIHYATTRGVALAQDSEAYLIDRVRTREEYICAQAKKLKEREEMEDAEDAEDELIDFGLDSSRD
ncbi:hypothetical protein F4803DRAFT_5541 [Xylaria telfairii]|nr:hypothetical protein F4803DRAFT_5541 [Xylaria telfairii]